MLRDIDILLILEKHISGGITEAVKCYANANNKCMKDQYKPDGTSTYLQYLDAHNIFILEKIDQWVKKKRYISEVDEEYPKAVHKEHN